MYSLKSHREASDGFHITAFISDRWIARTATDQTPRILVFVQKHKREEAAIARRNFLQIIFSGMSRQSMEYKDWWLQSLHRAQIQKRMQFVLDVRKPCGTATERRSAKPYVDFYFTPERNNSCAIFSGNHPAVLK